MGRALGLLLLAATAGCSPLYGYRAVAGHAKLLWNRRSVAESAVDPAVSPGPREKFKLVLDVRRFAVERLALSPTRDYAAWTPVDGAVSWLVYVCPRDSLKLRTFLGYPYKGHFRREWAEKEAAAWEKRGYDAAVFPATAYNTPLPVADPLPSTVLARDPGSVAELLIHEMTHGTVRTRDKSYDEALASWVGERGADEYLTARFGELSPERAQWKADGARAETREAFYEQLGALLDENYAAGAKNREKIFAWAREEAAKLGLSAPPLLNNAVVAAHRVYRGEPRRFDELFEECGRDWPRFITALKAGR